MDLPDDLFVSSAVLLVLVEVPTVASAVREVPVWYMYRAEEVLEAMIALSINRAKNMVVHRFIFCSSFFRSYEDLIQGPYTRGR